KQWGRKCSELPSFIIRRLPLRFTYDNNYINDRYQGIPIGGYTAMIAKMLEGIEVRLGCDYFVLKAEYEGSCSGTAADGQKSTPAGLGIARHVIYTGPIDEFFGYSAGQLEYRSLRFEKETLPTDNFQGCAVVNYTSADVPYTRIIEHRHFEFGKRYGGDDAPFTVITKEYPAAWKPGYEPYYPVNNDRNNGMYAEYAEMAENCPDVTFGGRLGCYKYYDMDKTVAAALETVRGMK
ncbi:MAG: UDP-galactopyranose mutase, partial [Lachnospiraceae bacterium]|nr:UDP-galactopyranose mutase [Lachnospiraceae bacterium]